MATLVQMLAVGTETAAPQTTDANAGKQTQGQTHSGLVAIARLENAPEDLRGSMLRLASIMRTMLRSALTRATATTQLDTVRAS